MGLFSNPNKNVGKVIKQMERQGATSNSYTSRNHCGSCRHFSSSSNNCNYHNKRTSSQELCHDYWGK